MVSGDGGACLTPAVGVGGVMLVWRGEVACCECSVASGGSMDRCGEGGGCLRKWWCGKGPNGTLACCPDRNI